MAIDIKNLLADAFLKLIEEKTMQKITVNDLLQQTGVSRQAFYNHFSDKNDLIQWIYKDRIMDVFNRSELEMDYSEALMIYCRNMEKYHHFLKEAFQQGGQNSLLDFFHKHPYEWDLAFHHRWCEQHRMDIPEEDLIFFTRYHSMAAIAITTQWILEDMPYPPETMVRRIIQMRTTSLNQLLISGQDSHPYKTT